MKSLNFFGNRFLTATEGNGGAPAPVAPTSELLTSLNAKLSAQRVELRATVTDEDTDRVSNEIVATRTAIKAEMANIAKLEKDAKLAEARQLRVAIKDNFAAAVIANYVATNDKKMSAEDKQAAADNLAGLEEKLVQELLAKHPASSTATTGKTDGVSGEKGATGKRILTAIESGLAAGQTWADIKAGLETGAITGQPESRGTVGAVYTKYKKDNGIV